MSREMPSALDRAQEHILQLQASYAAVVVNSKELAKASDKQRERIAELEQENQRLQAFVREYDLAAHGHAMPSWLDDARKTLDAK